MVRTPFIAALAASLVVCSSAGADAPELLPDLDQVAPQDVSVKSVALSSGRTVHRLGFASATENRGAGPLTLHGFRRSRGVRRMQVDQLVDHTDGSSRLIRNVGRMSYVVHPDHRHWHLLGFARYELHPMGTQGGGLRFDQKTGFCLGDRYRIRGARRLAGFQPFPAQGDTCGLGRPGLMGLFAGISVGYGDPYDAHIEGQYIDVTSAPPGRYLLVQTANPDGRLLESDYTNNSSSALLQLRRRPGRRPVVRILARCGGRDTCRARSRRKDPANNTRRSR